MSRERVGHLGSGRQGQCLFLAETVLRGAAVGDELPDLSTRALGRDELVEEIDQDGGVLGSLVAVGPEQTLDHVAQIGGRIRRESMQRRMIARQGQHDGRRVVGSVVGTLSSERLEQHHAEREQVSAPVERFCSKLLR